MRYLLTLLLAILCGCTSSVKTHTRTSMFTESDILQQLDQSFNGYPTGYFPAGGANDVRYNFYPDLEHGYCNTAASRIHLFADSSRWALVFEKSGYYNRAGAANIELYYFGNCIDYPVETYPERTYISNTATIVLVSPDEFSRIENKVGDDMETFELIGKDIAKIKLRDTLIPFVNDHKKYEQAGITIRVEDNPRHLIAFEDVLRYLNETAPELISATDDEIRRHISGDIPKLMTIDKFHFNSAYDKSKFPAAQELYQLIAKVLTTRDTSYWRPTQPPNNHWSNWESGNL